MDSKISKNKIHKVRSYAPAYLNIVTRKGFQIRNGSLLDLSDGQFSERCDVDGSFFNSDAIPIIFGKA